MSKYTAGPWSIPREMDSNLFGEAVSIKILDENGFPIAGLDCRPILHNWDEKFPKMGHWAEGADSGKTQIERSVEEMEANAKLIAAAPELLEACESAIPTGVCLTNKNIPDNFIVPVNISMGKLRKIAYAIAKARGVKHE